MASDDVWVLGIHMTKFGKHPDKDLIDLASEAALGALGDAGVTIKDIGVIGAGNLLGGATGQVLQKQLGQTGIPVYNVSNACATGATALRVAVMAIKAGECDMGLAFGVEKLSGAGLLAGGTRKEDDGTWTPSGRYGAVAAVDGRIGTEIMPGVFAQIGMEYGHKYGGTSFELFAKISEKNHAHSTLNPLAAYTKRMSLEEIMGDVMIAYPNTRPMCSANCDGAAAAVVVSGSKLKTLSLEQQKRAVKISASILTTDPWEEACQILPDVNTLTRNAVTAGLRASGRRTLGSRSRGVARLLRHGRVGALRQPHAVRAGWCGRLLQLGCHVAGRQHAGQRLGRPRVEGSPHCGDGYRQRVGSDHASAWRGGRSSDRRRQGWYDARHRTGIRLWDSHFGEGGLTGMASTVRGVVARAKGAPVTLEEIVVPDPGPGEAVVAVKACGVCHTDLHYREGGINDDFPFLLGHEAAGIVDAVGPGVTSVAPGDFVVLNWRAVCGECRACRRGRPWYCFATHNATQKMTLTDGIPLSPALGIGAFAEKTLVAAGQCTKVDPSARPEAVGLLGCGVMAGIGSAMFTGAVGLGDSVAVFGCGGVGCAAIAGAKLAGATTIIAIDLDARKLEQAKQFGATDVVDASAVDPVAAVQGLTEGNGADVCIEAVGNPKVMEQAFYARDLAGTLVQVGVPTPDMRIDLPMIEFFGRGGALKPSWYGDCLPDRDFPKLVDLYLAGRLNLDLFVSETIALDEVEEAFHRMQRGEVLRSVVVVG